MRKCFSHNIWVPEQTTDIGPLASLRPPGQLYNTAKSAVRALEIVEVLCRSPTPLRAIDIARAIGLSPSSADQVLKTLVDAAYLVFDPVTKRYYASLRLTTLSKALASAYFAEGAVEQLIACIYQTVHRPVHVLASQGSFMQIVATTDGHRHDSHRRTGPDVLGMRVPLFGSCSGAAWLATQSDETIRATVSLCRRQLGDQANDSAAVFQLVQRTREQGFAVGGVCPDNMTGGIAVALPKARNGLVLVLSVADLVAELTKKQTELAGLLKRKIEEILPPLPV